MPAATAAPSTAAIEVSGLRVVRGGNEVLPAFDALERVTLGESFGGRLAVDVAVTSGAILLALAAAAATLRRRTP